MVINAPAIGQLYGMPNDLRYAFADFERERINGQAVLQFAPTDSLTLTLDYTYSTNEITEDRGEQTMWLQRANSFTDLDVRHRPGGGHADLPPRHRRRHQGLRLRTAAQQAEVQAGFAGLQRGLGRQRRLRLTFDAHNSTTESRRTIRSPAAARPSSASPAPTTAPAVRYCGGSGGRSFWFNSGLPIGSHVVPDRRRRGARHQRHPQPRLRRRADLGSQVLRINYQRQETEIKQGRIDGEWVFDDGRFQFGVDSSKTTMTRSRPPRPTPTLGDWGVANAGDEPGMIELLQPFDIIGMFDDFRPDGAAPGAWRGRCHRAA